ncbi:MAG TPA: flagellar biosynthetic protein FliO [Pyrinomonadaceae bacterium]|jgi:flagellar protein FliO/FliZ|nr:flagellar biosynthetic protein FliO [Pyrinomonadaceae bacterium]
MSLQLPKRPAHLCAAFVAVWWQQAAAPYNPAQYEGGGAASFLLMLLQTLFALALVCGLAYAIFRWVLPRLQVTRSTNSMIRIVDRVALDARKSMFVIEVGGRWLLVASSEAGVQLISELDAAKAGSLADELEQSRLSWRNSPNVSREAIADSFARILKRKK